MNSNKIVLPLVNGRMKAFSLSDILFCRSDGYLTILYSKEDGDVSSFIVNKRLGTMEELFSAHPINSYRTHRSYIVNADNLKPYGRYPSTELEFQNGMVAKLSRRKKLDFHNYCRNGERARN